MQLNTDFKLAGPLAGLFGGITQAQEQERQGLSNAYQMLKNQEQEYTSAEAQAKMNDPQYIQMKLQNDMSKFGKETSLNEIESAYNKANRAVAHLKAAQAMGPQALQQASMQYLQEMGIDPASEKGQMLLKDPVGNAEKLSQFYATAATNNSEYMQKYGLQERKGQLDLDKAREEIAGRERVANIGANASLGAAKYSADKGLTGSMLGYAKDLRGELDNINTNITKLEGKEMDNAIFDAFRQSGKTNATQEDVDKYKSDQLAALRQRKLSVESDLTDARSAVRGRIGIGQGDGTKEKPIKLS